MISKPLIKYSYQPRTSQEVKESLNRFNKFVNLKSPNLVVAKINSKSSNAATKKFLQSKDIVSYLDLPVTDITGVPFKGTAIRPVYSLDSSDDDEQTTSSSKRRNPFESDEEELQSSSKVPKHCFRMTRKKNVVQSWTLISRLFRNVAEKCFSANVPKVLIFGLLIRTESINDFSC